MSVEQPEPFDDERLTKLRAACDEALATGSSVDEVIDAVASAELRSRLEQDAAWCRLVRLLLTARGDDPADPSEPSP